MQRFSAYLNVTAEPRFSVPIWKVAPGMLRWVSSAQIVPTSTAYLVGDVGRDLHQATGQTGAISVG